MAKELRYCDYYGLMTLADFTAFKADCEAGKADPAMHDISTSSTTL